MNSNAFREAVISKRVRKYSGGMMRRLEIGTAIVHNPPLIILDEPTIGLDPKGRYTVWDVLRRLVHELGTTIFMTTHDMSEADELCDRLAIINHGKIYICRNPYHYKLGCYYSNFCCKYYNN